jgi:hypothetical protein
MVLFGMMAVVLPSPSPYGVNAMMVMDGGAAGSFLPPFLLAALTSPNVRHIFFPPFLRLTS